MTETPVTDSASTVADDVAHAHAPPTGLSAAEVDQRVREGRTNDVPSAPERTLGQIVRSNVLTPVNAIIGSMFVLIMVAGFPADALFAGVIVSNSIIGIAQELKARRTLHKLAVLSAPRARVLRDGETREVDTREVVADDVLELRPGDQVVVDGEVLRSWGLELDESLLTGESDRIGKSTGDGVMSGSFVSAGAGWYQATAIGADSYAAKLAEEARRFRLAGSELKTGVNRILKRLTLIIPPASLLLILRLLGTEDRWQEALRGTVAAAVAMVPDGLVLLTSLSFITGVIALARRRALARELASVELLARVDTLCLDKTGTITTGAISLDAVEPCGSVTDDEAAEALAALAASDPAPNATLEAIAQGVGEPSAVWTRISGVPFSSARKWAASCFEARGTYHLGAPEVLLAPSQDEPEDGVVSDTGGNTGDETGHGVVGGATPYTMPLLSTGQPSSESTDRHARSRDAARARAAAASATGSRVLAVTRCDTLELSSSELPRDREPVCLVHLSDTIRPDAAEIFSFFRDQGVDLKVISGDNPRAVAAIAERAGIVGHDEDAASLSVLDARQLSEDSAELADTMESTTVFGRVNPHQKRAMVHALQSRGRTVAMTGDGVNDVLALKDADMGIAMGSGSSAARAVAQLVLLDNRFSTLPRVLAEGRRVINNIERVANLFITKAAYAVLLTVLVGVFGSPFPFLPRHLTLIGTFSVGVPGFFLALAPNHRLVEPGFLTRVLRFSLPAGTVAAATTFVLYEIVRRIEGITLDEARTSATMTLLGVTLVILVLISRPLRTWKVMLVAAMAVSYGVTMAWSPLRDFFRLDVPPLDAWPWVGAAIALGGIAASVIVLARERRAASRGQSTP